MRRLAGVGFAFWCLLGAASTPAAAQALPANANQPGATLLLPYFEVDLADAQGTNTLFSINNASATAMLAHVTIWSDYGVAVTTFDMYLTGYDVQALSMRDVLQGALPATASDGQDLQDTISPQGPVSQDINFAACNGVLPPAALPGATVTALQAALTGSASSLTAGLCASSGTVGNQVARGYVTVDTVNACNSLKPGDIGYAAFLTSQNTLWGDYAIVNPSQDTAYGDALVSIAASNTDPELTTAGEYTFYGGVNGWTAADRREPLSTTFAARFVAPKDFKGSASKANRRPYLPASTELIVWRDPKVSVAPFTCGTTPAYYPLSQEQVLAFNESETPEAPVLGAPPFPKVSQRVTVGTGSLPLTTASGWLYLNLNHHAAAAGANPSTDQLAAQAWVTVLHRTQQGPNGGRYDAGFRAMRFDGARDAYHDIIP